MKERGTVLRFFTALQACAPNFNNLHEVLYSVWTITAFTEFRGQKWYTSFFVSPFTGDIYSDHNGETWRGSELGHALVRCQGLLEEQPAFRLRSG